MEERVKQTKVFGIRAIIEAINSGSSVDKVFLQKGTKGPLMQELNGLIKEHNISFNLVPVEKLDRLSKHMNHQGAVAQIAAVPFHDLNDILEKDTDQKLLLLLDGVSDVRNFGAIIRTAECTGVDAIVIAKKWFCTFKCRNDKNFCRSSIQSPYL